MLYLLGGAARSGTSVIAKRFLIETGIPFFCLDYLMMGFANGLPEYGIHPEDDELYIGELLWPVIRPLAVALDEDGIDYLIEGAQLLPKHVGELCEQLNGHVRACFIGFADLDVMAKFHQMRKFGGGLDDWLREYDDHKVILEIERLKAFSENLRNECAKYGLKYFETSTDLEQTVGIVVRYLKENRTRR
jgi:hypothetical protein